MSNSLDSVGPDLGPNCLQRLSAGNTGRHSVKTLNFETGGPKGGPGQIV